MKWPWSRRETRQTAVTEATIRQIESAAMSASDAGATAAVEAASGTLARALASASVQGPPHVVEAVTGRFLASVGRDLIRDGASCWVPHLGEDGRMSLLPAASWDWFRGSGPRSSWVARVTVQGPTAQLTRMIPWEGVVFATWSQTAGNPHVGRGPLSWASITTALTSRTETSLSNEARGAVAPLLAVPPAGARHGDVDPNAQLQADIAAAEGRPVIVETTAEGYGQGRGSAPMRPDLKPARLGPMPPAEMVKLRIDAFNATVAACGVPPTLFAVSSDGTAQREAYRRLLTMTVAPLARILAEELSEKLEAEVTFDFSDLRAHDLGGRAAAFQRLVTGGMSVEEAVAVTGLMVQ